MTTFIVSFLPQLFSFMVSGSTVVLRHTPNKPGGGWQLAHRKVFKENFTVHPTILHTSFPTESWMSFDAYFFDTREHVKRSVISPDFCYCTVFTVKEIGGEPDRKPRPLPYGLKNPYRNSQV
jgi:hypothetical protein